MAVHLTHLRIAGFKSFADPVELAILPGLTGLVGPNGCGKSNVADALRWAMGEGHARTLRGAEMDDRGGRLRRDTVSLWLSGVPAGCYRVVPLVGRQGHSVLIMPCREPVAD